MGPLRVPRETGAIVGKGGLARQQRLTFIGAAVLLQSLGQVLLLLCNGAALNKVVQAGPLTTIPDTLTPFAGNHRRPVLWSLTGHRPHAASPAPSGGGGGAASSHCQHVHNRRPALRLAAGDPFLRSLCLQVRVLTRVAAVLGATGRRMCPQRSPVPAGFCCALVPHSKSCPPYLLRG